MEAKMKHTAIVFPVLLLFLGTCQCYKHVILMHGLFGSASEFFELENYIRKAHPGTNITAINQFDHLSSLEPLWRQTNKIRGLMADVMKSHPDGVHLVCYSQGGLVCRAVLETLPDHNVHNFVSLSSPQGGQYGDTYFLKYLFPHLLKEELYKVFYSSTGQKLAIANYWNDPHHQQLYQNYSDFIAVLNNDSVPVNLTRSMEYKKNFLRLNHLVLIGGPQDEVITPWQSSHFGAYDANETVLEMRKQKWYLEDSFGLRTLDERKAITTHVIPGHRHLDWPRNYTIFKNCIEPWLT